MSMGAAVGRVGWIGVTVLTAGIVVVMAPAVDNVAEALPSRVVETIWVDQPSADAGPAAGGTAEHDMSADGRHIAFVGAQANLVTGDTNGVFDVFVRDLVEGRTVRVSVSGTGAQSASESRFPSISGDGRWVSFVTTSSLDPADTNGSADVYIRDRDVDGDGVFDEPDAVSTTLVSRVQRPGQPFGAVGNGTASAGGQLSTDGRWLLFRSRATNLDPLDTVGDLDVYALDRDVDEDGIYDEPGSTSVTLISRRPDGSPGGFSADSGDIAISDDGRYVLLSSQEQLDPADTGVTFNDDAYLIDRDADADGIYDEIGETSVRWLARALDGTPTATPGSGPIDMSSDGRYLLFERARRCHTGRRRDGVGRARPGLRRQQHLRRAGRADADAHRGRQPCLDQPTTAPSPSCPVAAISSPAIPTATTTRSCVVPTARCSASPSVTVACRPSAVRAPVSSAPSR